MVKDDGKEMKIRTFRYRRRRFEGLRNIISRLFNRKNKSWKPKKQRSWKTFFLKWGGGIFVAIFLYGWIFLPSVDDADQLAFSESTIIYDRGALDPTENPNDHILYVIHGDENREYIPLDEIPQHVKDATIAIEDDGFYRHFGFDIGAIVKATLNHFFGIGSARGGSTITQQLVKNTFLSRERTVTRKFNELLLSMKVEWYYTKDEILELYLNNIPYGNNAHGVEAAAKTFFDKSARDLTLAEAAVLASLPVAPTRFSPYGSNKDSLMGFYEYEEGEEEKVYKKGRKDLVLERMLDLDMITEEEFKQAWAESGTLEFRRARIDIKAPHFVFYVREKMEEKYGKEFIKSGGLRIYTTLDPELQQIAEDTIETKSAGYLETYGAQNVAMTAINNDTGEILAYIGGKDFFDQERDGQVDVLTSRRQPGSSFKPFTYAAAFEKGYNPSTLVFDVETDFGGNYQPQNFDGNFLGPVSLREALNRSLNIPAIKVAYLADPINVLKLAEKLGILFEGSAERHGVAVGVGVAEVEPLSHINAYQAFAGDGTYHEITAILEVQDSEGNVLETFDPDKTKRDGLDPEIAGLVRHILTDESTRPTTDDFDWNILLQLPGLNNGSKTGTSNRTAENPNFNEEEPEDEENNPRFITVPGDSWTIGFTPHLVSGVWVGNNRGEPMKSGATGLTVAAPIWKNFMVRAHEALIEKGAKKDKVYNEPKPLEVRKINKFSGKIATDRTPKNLVKEEVFASFAVPTELDTSVQTINIDKKTGRRAESSTPFYSRTQKFALTGLQSIRPNLPNWQKPVEEWLHDHPRFLTSLGTIRDSEQSQDLFQRRDELRFRSQNRRTSLSTSRVQYPPEIQILSPQNGGRIARGPLEVRISATSRYGIRAVEYYFDDKLMADSTRFPWTGRWQVPSDTELGSEHTIKVVVIDQRSQATDASIDIVVEQDTTGPIITFLGPIGGQNIVIGSTVHIIADVQDQSSGVKVVEFSLDDNSLGFAENHPFEAVFTANEDLGRHMIKAKAWDYHGNVSEKSIPVTFDREKIIHSNRPAITKVANYRSSLSADLIFPDPDQVEWAELIVEKNDDILFSKRINPSGKFAQIQIPKQLIGKAQVTLITKMKSQDKVLETIRQTIDF